MRSFVTSLVLLSLVPARANAQAMEEIPTPSDRAHPPVAAPQSSPVAAPSPAANPQAEWDHRFLAFEDWAAYNVHTGAVVNTWSRPVEGTYRRPLSYGEFYDRVGRGDLADRYRSRRNVKIGLAVAGGVAFIAGFGAIIGQFVSNSSSFSSCVDGNVFGRGPQTSCDLNSGNEGYIAGGVLVGVGFIGVMTGLIMPMQPAQPYEAREMADQYNKKLRGELGLDSAPPTPAPTPAAGTTLTLAPSVDAKGAGLRLVARF
jgi:hypothetical protein